MACRWMEVCGMCGGIMTAIRILKWLHCSKWLGIICSLRLKSTWIFDYPAFSLVYLKYLSFFSFPQLFISFHPIFYQLFEISSSHRQPSPGSSQMYTKYFIHHSLTPKLYNDKIITFAHYIGDSNKKPTLVYCEKKMCVPPTERIYTAHQTFFCYVEALLLLYFYRKLMVRVSYWVAFNVSIDFRSEWQKGWINFIFNIICVWFVWIRWFLFFVNQSFHSSFVVIIVLFMYITSFIHFKWDENNIHK